MEALGLSASKAHTVVARLAFALQSSSASNGVVSCACMHACQRACFSAAAGSSCLHALPVASARQRPRSSRAGQHHQQQLFVELQPLRSGPASPQHQQQLQPTRHPRLRTAAAAYAQHAASSSPPPALHSAPIVCSGLSRHAGHGTAWHSRHLLPVPPVAPLPLQLHHHQRAMCVAAGAPSSGVDSSSASTSSTSTSTSTSTPTTTTSSSSSSSSERHDLGDEPIIVTASWLGAKRGPFSKYKALWHSLGYANVLSARPPMTSIMFPLQGQLLAASFTHKLLQAARQRPRAPILVHLFSGGGFIFVGWVFQLLADLKSAEAAAVRGRIAGIVLDSSPALVTPDVSSRALVAAALGRPAAGIEAALPWLVKPTAAMVAGYLQLPFVREALVGVEAAWASAAPRCPLLCLYSDADALIEPAVVEQFMRARAADGCVTVARKFAGSAHVDHLRRYPHEYAAQVAAFAADAVQRWRAAQAAAPGGGGGGSGSGSSPAAAAGDAAV